MHALWLEDNEISFRDVSQPRKANVALIKIRENLTAGQCDSSLVIYKDCVSITERRKELD